MEWRKLKDIIILILVVVNSFLLVLVWSRREESAKYERMALEQTVEVLERGGVQVALESAAPAAGLAPLAVERDLNREAALVRALLGEEVQGDNRGGGLYLYRGGAGEVSLRAGGELSAVLAEDERWRAGRPESHAASLLKDLGVEAEWLNTDEGNGETRVRFRQNWNGAPVFSGEVEFAYEGGLLRTIRGTLLTSGQGTEEAGQVLTLPTALMRFSEEIVAAGDVCTAIQSMEPGYRGTAQSLSGGLRLTPVWLVSTDTADYYLDGLTGALTRLDDQGK